MPAVVSMLRGVNVGGHNQIKMEDLRALCETLGLRDVQTYIQSGNVVFRAKERDLAHLAERIADAIEERRGFRPGVVVRTSAELRAAVDRNPFPAQAAADPGRLVAIFLSAGPDPDALAKTLRINVGPEIIRFDGRELYIYFPNGQGRSKLTLPLVEKTLKTAGTGRNWNTAIKLLEMAERLEVS
jgi:uncharacterized protein (DUF1697 family)